MILNLSDEEHALLVRAIDAQYEEAMAGAIAGYEDTDDDEDGEGLA